MYFGYFDCSCVNLLHIYPGLTFLNIGWIVTIILGLWGISSIVSYATSRNDGNNKEKALMGTLGLIAGIAAAVVSALAMFMPGIRVMFDILILAIFAVWLIVDGISSIATSFKVKKIRFKCMGTSAYMRSARTACRHIRNI